MPILIVSCAAALPAPRAVAATARQPATNSLRFMGLPLFVLCAASWNSSIVLPANPGEANTYSAQIRGDNMLHHFIVTRIGIGIHNENWYRGALGLFEAITFPSLCAQTCPDFTCLLIIDRNIPESAKSRLDAITVMQQVHQGCFDYIWERCQDDLLAHRMIVDPFEYIITSVLDADDAWHVETVDLVQKRMTEEMPAFLASERRNVTWTRHTGGACLAFANGLRWYAHPDVVVPLHRLFGDMFVFVAARFSSGISACSSRHTQWASYCNVVDFKDIKCEQAMPMWVYVRHDRSEVSWDVKDDESDPQTPRRLWYRLRQDTALARKS